MKKILEVRNLKKIYHTKNEEILAIDDVNFSVCQGEFISIVGPSGCGKSTILSILSGLIPKSDGEIILAPNKKIAYMLQDDCLLPHRTILDNCLIGLEINNELNKSNIEYVINLLNSYGLSEFIYKYPNNLSGGMKQRVALIRTLATRPDILLLDEATSALDYQSSVFISNDIYNIIKNEGKTAQAISMSDRIIMLSKRPCSVKNIYDITFNNKSDPITNRKDEKFSYYYDLIWRDLDVSI